VQPSRVGTTPCFQIVKGTAAASGDAGSRALKFKDDEGVNREFKHKVGNMIAFKIYLDHC
jgi:hypothetical protein